MQVRSGGADAVEALANANQGNRLSHILRDATERAKGGSSTGEVRVFSPSQLQMANQASGRRFPGVNPLAELADNGQRVLPSTVPNSGTSDRALAAAALGTVGLGGLGIGESQITGDTENTQRLAAAAALLTALGTRKGQQLMQRAAFDRPNTAQRVGRAISSRRGLFGSGAVPLALQAQ